MKIVYLKCYIFNWVYLTFLTLSHFSCEDMYTTHILMQVVTWKFFLSSKNFTDISGINLTPLATIPKKTHILHFSIHLINSIKNVSESDSKYSLIFWNVLVKEYILKWYISSDMSLFSFNTPLKNVRLSVPQTVMISSQTASVKFRGNWMIILPSFHYWLHKLRVHARLNNLKACFDILQDCLTLSNAAFCILLLLYCINSFTNNWNMFDLGYILVPFHSNDLSWIYSYSVIFLVFVSFSAFNKLYLFLYKTCRHTKLVQTIVMKYDCNVS